MQGDTGLSRVKLKPRLHSCIRNLLGGLSLASPLQSYFLITAPVFPSLSVCAVTREKGLWAQLSMAQVLISDRQLMLWKSWLCAILNVLSKGHKRHVHQTLHPAPQRMVVVSKLLSYFGQKLQKVISLSSHDYICVV